MPLSIALVKVQGDYDTVAEMSPHQYNFKSPEVKEWTRAEVFAFNSDHWRFEALNGATWDQLFDMMYCTCHDFEPKEIELEYPGLIETLWQMMDECQR